MNHKLRPNSPAFNHEVWGTGFPTEEDINREPIGLSKREEFIKAAMQGLCARKGGIKGDIATKAVRIADAVIAEINESIETDLPGPESIEVAPESGLI